jgi:surfactin synthase thioesterase subunit
MSVREPVRTAVRNEFESARFFDTGHFALETHAREIAESIRDFLK